MPNLASVSSRLINYVKPEDKFSEDIALPLSTFKQAHLFDPSKVADIQPTADDIEDVRILMHELKHGLPAEAEDIASTVVEEYLNGKCTIVVSSS